MIPPKTPPRMVPYPIQDDGDDPKDFAGVVFG